MTTPQTLTNLAQQICTSAGITRVAAGLLALPAVMVTPWLLICNHPFSSCVAVANLVSVGIALKTGGPMCLIPALGITGGIFGYSIYHSWTNNPNYYNCKKKPRRVALEIETYVRPH